MIARLIGILTIAITLTSCGSLKGTIEIINPQYLVVYKEQTLLRNQLSMAIGQLKADLVEDVRSTKELLTGFFIKTSKRRMNALGCTAPFRSTPCAAAKGLRDIPDSSQFQAFFDQYIDKIDQSNQSIRNIYNSYDKKSKDAVLRGNQLIDGRLATLIKSRAAIVNAFSGKVAVYIPQQISHPSLSEKMEQKNVISEAESNQGKTLMGGRSSIDSDALAYAVANAPKGAFTEYNVANIKARFGNADMIVTLDDNADFTVKGLTFDPRTVAAIASKVTTQAIIMGAHIAGVPISAPDTNNQNQSGATLATASSQMAKKEQRLKDAQEKKKDYYRALIEIAETVIQEKGKIKNNNSISGAAQTVRAMFDSHSSRLDFPDIREVGGN